MLFNSRSAILPRTGVLALSEVSSFLPTCSVFSFPSRTSLDVFEIEAAPAPFVVLAGDGFVPLGSTLPEIGSRF